MSKFKFHGNGITGEGFEIYDVIDVETGRDIGLVANSSARRGWIAYVLGDAEIGFPTRQAAAERLRIVNLPALVAESTSARVAQSALPADPFEGVSA